VKFIHIEFNENLIICSGAVASLQADTETGEAVSIGASQGFEIAQRKKRTSRAVMSELFSVSIKSLVFLPAPLPGYMHVAVSARSPDV
jgi:hypothetical protein